MVHLWITWLDFQRQSEVKLVSALSTTISFTPPAQAVRQINAAPLQTFIAARSLTRIIAIQTSTALIAKIENYAPESHFQKRIAESFSSFS